MIDLTTLGRVTSGFGQRTSPTAGASTNHRGIDIVLNDEKIPAVLGGEVVYVGYSKTGGNMVSIKQEDGTIGRYMHMASPSTLSIGDSVKEGQTVGIMGSTGVSTGNHVHYDVMDEAGNFLDPVEYFAAGFDPIDPLGAVKDSVAGSAMGLVGNIITVLAVLLIIILAIYLFMKAFDIKLM